LLSVEAQKFPPDGSNNSPDQSVSQGCYKTKPENIWKLKIPRCRMKANRLIGMPLSKDCNIQKKGLLKQFIILIYSIVFFVKVYFFFMILLFTRSCVKIQFQRIVI
jgi:hypothetical protein